MVVCILAFLVYFSLIPFAFLYLRYVSYLVEIVKLPYSDLFEKIVSTLMSKPDLSILTHNMWNTTTPT